MEQPKIIQSAPSPHRWPAVILGLATLIALAVGLSATFNPVEFANSNGNDVAGNTNALSEMRSAGGAILLAAALMFAGLVRPALRHTALTIATVIYLGYGMGRVVSALTDGVPHDWLVAAMGAELIVGAMSAAALYATRPSAASAETGRPNQAPEFA